MTKRLALSIWIITLLSSPLRAADFDLSGGDAETRLLGPISTDDPIGAGPCAGCHADVAAAWSRSAHRFASFNNPYYQAAVEQFRHDRGEKESRFCAGCHDPVLVASGAIDRPIDAKSRQAQAGIVCLVCHSIDGTSVTGNGQYHARVTTVPPSGPAHRERLRSPLLGTGELCANCHKVGLDEAVTHRRWLRGQDDYGPWQSSSVSGQGARSIHRAPEMRRCQDCHMPLEKATLGDAAARPDKDGVLKVRSHRFFGANAALAHLRGDEETVEKIRAFLAGSVKLEVAPVSALDVDVVLRPLGVGHRFPGGTMDSNEVWLEVTAIDNAGKSIAQSGGLDRRGRRDAAAHLVRAQVVDEAGRPLLRRDVQFATGVVYDASLAPGDPQAIRYRLPALSRRIRARLLYRKFTPDYAEFACTGRMGEDKQRCLEPPILEIARAEIDLSPRAWSETCAHAPWESLLDHGIALAAALSDRAEEARPYLECARRRAPERIEPVLGLMRLEHALGRTDEVVALLAEAEKVRSSHPAALLTAAAALVDAYRFSAARPIAERLAKILPRDLSALLLLARTRDLESDFAGALAAVNRLLEIDPESENGQLERSWALKGLGRDAEAESAEAQYLRHRTATEENLALRERFRALSPGLAEEAIPVHTHVLTTRSVVVSKIKRARARPTSPAPYRPG
jgi:tetratricopeptide (TPR) repeat protein